MTIPTLPNTAAATATQSGDLWILVPVCAQGEVLVVNPTGYEIFRRCDGTRSGSEIANQLAGTTGTPVADVEPDVIAFIARLAAAGLVSG